MIPQEEFVLLKHKFFAFLFWERRHFVWIASITQNSFLVECDSATVDDDIRKLFSDPPSKFDFSMHIFAVAAALGEISLEKDVAMRPPLKRKHDIIVT